MSHQPLANLFSLQPLDERIELSRKIGNHDDQNHQQERIGIDDP
jgi:hypothetical protein